VASKSEVAPAVCAALLQLERQSGASIQQLRSDRDTEFLTPTLRAFCQERGIVHQTSSPYTPEQNGVAERLNRTLLERLRALLADSGLPKNMWAEVLRTACYLRNISPGRKRGATPHELLFGSRPEVGHLRVLGCRCYVLLPDQQRSTNLHPVTVRGRMLGYAQHSKGYRVLLDDGRVVDSSNFQFDGASVAGDWSRRGGFLGSRSRWS
jgi:transposase InsO family protein